MRTTLFGISCLLALSFAAAGRTEAVESKVAETVVGGGEPAMAASPETATSLPFTITVVPDELKTVPDYMGAKPPINMDFPPCAVKIDDEYWIIFRNRTSPKVFRYKGTTIENAQRQPDGDAGSAEMKGAYILGGMWYDETEKKLYAPLHHEFLTKWKQVSLATSTDKGLTWKYEGLIVATYDPNVNSTPKDYEGDFYLHVDARGGYFYLYGLLYASEGHDMAHFVARCAIKDKMAPGKWTKFYKGGWTEPGLGGKSSHVNAYYVMYNTYLKKYLSFNLGSSLSFCTDLEKQDWSPSFKVGNTWGRDRAFFGYHVTDDAKTDTCTGGKTLYVWSYYQNRWGGRYRIELGAGKTPNREGYHVYGALFERAECFAASMNPGMLYPYRAIPEASDPIMARKTRQVGCNEAEIKYSGSWSSAGVDPRVYPAGAAKCATDSGAIAEFCFKGKDIYWRALKGPTQGQADVYLDGVFQTTVDCSSTHPLASQFAFIKRGLSGAAPHTIKVVVKGKAGQLSTGNAVTHIMFEESIDP